MYKGRIKGRKGEWLGLQMDETVGDCDGTVGEDRYFTCEDTQGLFIKWESGRVVATPDRAVIPQPVLEHMLMLFETCDASRTGGLDVGELLQAMQLLGQGVTKKDAQAIFKRIVNDADRVSSLKTGIEFDEFRRVMEEQWLGVDLDAVVRSIQEEEQAELEKQEAARLAALEQDLAIDVMGVTVDLNYFGAGTNVGLLVVYSCMALAVTGQVYLHVPEDMLTFFMVAVLGGSAALFGIGGVAIKTQNWPLVKLYSVLLFFAAGMQFAVCIAFKVGLLQMSTSVVAAVMDRECGTCVGAERCATVSSSVLPAQADAELGDQPWYCCCAHNECRGTELAIQAQATCEDSCALADLTDSDTASRASCIAQGDAAGPPASTCVYLGATDAVCNRGSSCPQDDPTHPTLHDECYTTAGVAIGGDLPSCPAMTGLDSAAASVTCLAAAGCEYTPGTAKTCTQNEEVSCGDHAQSESACTSTGVCVYTPAVYGSHVADLSAEEEETMQMCQTRDEYLDFARVHAYPMLSVLGDDQCFDRIDDPNEASGYAGKLLCHCTANAQRRSRQLPCKRRCRCLLTGLAGCLESYQSSMQVWYLVIQMLMLPIVLLAAYVGWVLPDIYIQKVTQSQAQGVDSFLSTLNFSNPIDEEAGNGDGTKEGKDEVLSEASTIAGALIQAKQVCGNLLNRPHLHQQG